MIFVAHPVNAYFLKSSIRHVCREHYVSIRIKQTPISEMKNVADCDKVFVPRLKLIH